MVSPRNQTLELKRCPYGRHMLDSQVPAKVLFLSVRVPRTNMFLQNRHSWGILVRLGSGGRDACLERLFWDWGFGTHFRFAIVHPRQSLHGSSGFLPSHMFTSSEPVPFVQRSSLIPKFSRHTLSTESRVCVRVFGRLRCLGFRVTHTLGLLVCPGQQRCLPYLSLVRVSC